jgi:hypothetical protein
MSSRIRPLAYSLLFLVAASLSKAANLDGSSAEVGNAEAERLYKEANAYVKNMAEGDYSYAYLQFYWKRAQANVDRIRRVYADSPMAKAMSRGEVKLGPYDLDYFKVRVLYNLEVKQRAAFDDVNCAIFLYGMDESRSDATRDAALASILEVLSRRQRWGEALRFPVLDSHKPLLLGTIFTVAANYNQKDIVKKLIEDTAPALQERAGFDTIQARALVLRGVPREETDKDKESLWGFVAKHPSERVRRAVMQAVVDRAILVHRFETHHLPPGNSIQTVHDNVQALDVHDDVKAVAARLFPSDSREAEPYLETYLAALGTEPSDRAPLSAHSAYLQYLADQGKLDAVVRYSEQRRLSADYRSACALKAVEFLAEAGSTKEASELRTAITARTPALANAAAFAEFTGRMNSREVALVAKTDTFAELPITDPCVMAKAIMDWSLTPNRSQRGAAPWDKVVFRFAGGFANLPEPKALDVSNAASTVKPY